MSENRSVCRTKKLYLLNSDRTGPKHISIFTLIKTLCSIQALIFLKIGRTNYEYGWSYCIDWQVNRLN